MYPKHKFRIYLIFIITLIQISYVNLFSQTYPCDIKYRDGKVQLKTQMLGLYKDLLLVTDSGYFKIVNIEKVQKVRFDNGSYMWTGAGIGAGIGFISGYFLYEFFREQSTKFLSKDATVGIFLVTTIPSAIIGGIIGSMFRNIDLYDMSEMNNFTKAKELKFILRYHSKWR